MIFSLPLNFCKINLWATETQSRISSCPWTFTAHVIIAYDTFCTYFTHTQRTFTWKQIFNKKTKETIFKQIKVNNSLLYFGVLYYKLSNADKLISANNTTPLSELIAIKSSVMTLYLCNNLMIIVVDDKWITSIDWCMFIYEAIHPKYNYPEQ